MRTRVKICGITRRQDALAAVEYGADAIGLVFYPDSPRFVSTATAREIASSVPPFVTVTGLFVNAAEDVLNEALASVPLGLLQFHGQETNAECNHYGLPFIKSVPMRPGLDSVAMMDSYPDAAGFLLDAWLPDTHGGGGEVFDWDTVPGYAHKPMILAGGLTAENVAAAIRAVRPYAVDVSSGVESSRGIKSAERINEFMQGVHSSGTDTAN
ncbi:MAG: phosphoribosylanthranilate isomerase [Gammaproteobacteria bacterium]|nr:phosphoribosylanthranilate isomerase [Gammaproteobacteria bacterium]